MNTNLPLVICDIAVKQDKEKRFCLNDLHKASGSEVKHEPNRFTRLAMFSDLVKELTPDMEVAPAEIRKGGKQPGIFVCKELVYAYAMWISPKFHLRVIRTFDAVIADEYQRMSYRDVARLEYKPMTDAIKHEREAQGKTIAPHHFSNEADLINRIALGVTAAKFRVQNEINKSEPIRDYLSPEQIRCITDLQRANTVFINMGWKFEQRKAELTRLFERNHKTPLIEETHYLAA